MSGMNVMVWNGGDLEKLEVLQNRVGLLAIGIPKWMAAEALRGNLGWSLFSERMVKAVLNYKVRIERMENKSSIAAVGAVIVTNPLDVIKTRLQLQGELKAAGEYKKVYSNVFQGAFKMIQAEGVRGLQRGVGPASAYQVVMNGTRLSLFQKLHANGYLNGKDGKLSNGKCAIGSAAVGVLSGFIASPWYMVKVQLQSEADPRLAVGTQHHHQNVFSALRSAVSSGGLLGLYRGASTSLFRVGVGSSAQLFTYTKCRDALHNAGVCTLNSSYNALAGAMLSGVAVTAAMTPFDVLSTRMRGHAGTRPTVQRLVGLPGEGGAQGRPAGPLQRMGSRVPQDWAPQLSVPHILGHPEAAPPSLQRRPAAGCMMCLGGHLAVIPFLGRCQGADFLCAFVNWNVVGDSFAQ
ncbi:Mitochondrial substrate/solute carrier [Trinorchestia longiramus]|nr:Mitochondrial substrate/solute carrier [Trinorchestia longiramus]